MFGLFKKLIGKSTPEEDKNSVYDYKLAKLLSVISKLEFGKEGPINLETSKYKNELDESLSSFLRWCRFNMDKEEVINQYEIFCLIDYFLPKYLSVLPITNNLTKFIAERNKLERINKDFE